MLAKRSKFSEFTFQNLQVEMFVVYRLIQKWYIFEVRISTRVVESESQGPGIRKLTYACFLK